MTPSKLIDSEGNEIKNPEQFMRWFSGSVAVDQEGRPKVFYHASYEDFDEFMFPWERDEDNYESEGYDGGNLGIGFYFTDNEKYAKRFGTPKKFYLKITHLLVATDEDVVEEINRRAKDPDEDWMYGAYGEVIDQICKEERYDGVIGEGVGGLSYGASEIMVKSANQIKSIANGGAWSDNSKLFESLYHGTPDRRNMAGKNGIHIGTQLAATQALESRIGVPADGVWDGTREYGKTLLAGRKRLAEISKERGYAVSTGYNCGNDLPDENYYPSQRKSRASYSDRTEVPMDATPSIFPVSITGKMSNTAYHPHSDSTANRLMNRYSKSGNAKSGYFYKNDAEDAGSISAVVPDTSFLQFEGVDYVSRARQFTTDIITSLINLTESDIVNSYVGMNAKYKAPEFSIRDTASITPTGIPLHIILRPRHANYAGMMDSSIDPPALVLFAGEPPKTLDDCANTIIAELNSNTQLYVHELIHLFDRNTFDLPKYRRPSVGQLKSHANALRSNNPDVGEIDMEALRYLNAPTEINARVISAIDDAITNGAINTFDEFKNAVLANEQIKVGFLKHNNPTKFSRENYAKILKLLYKVYNNLMDI